MTVRTRQIHRAFAGIIVSFAILHLSNHLLAWGGIALHTRGLEWLRLLYRNPLAETVLILAIAGQVAIGLHLAFIRWRAGTAPGWARLQLASGLALAIFLSAHVTAALLARHSSGIDTNFYWPAGTLVLAPLKYGFWPYYMAAIFALFAHVASALHFNGFNSAAKGLVWLGALLSPIIVLPFSGALYPIELPQQHLEYFDSFLPDACG